MAGGCLDTRRAVKGLLAAARKHRERVAVADGSGEHTFGELLRASEAVARSLLRRAARAGGELEEGRVGLLAEPGLAWVAGLWGIWRAGGVAVPLCTFHPPAERAYVLEDADVAAILAGPGCLEDAGAPTGVGDVPVVPLGPCLAAGAPPPPGRGRAEVPARRAGGERFPASGGPGPGGLPEIAGERRALILYTSGTTGRPKGVVHTHGSLAAQLRSLVEAWAWSPDDRILHVLPLHHTHGIVNALLCALRAGAACEMLPHFEAEAVWQRLAASVGGRRPPLTLLMAVPTIYVRLLAAWRAAPPAHRRRWAAGARGLRLAVSGSAALPETVFEEWHRVTGHRLLERYGTTETGMVLSNPLRGERRPGTVGGPLPGVEVRLTDEAGRVLAVGGETPDAGPGEIEVRGPTLFREYWRRPGATREAFRAGWFRTGDVATVGRDGWRILGRSSVDILKTGGYKISALEVEEAVREHPDVADCAVVGVPDPEWGERVCAAVVPGRPRSDLGERLRPGTVDPGGSGLARSLERWVRERLAPYKVPRRWLFVEALPRNALGKVVKPEVRSLFERASVPEAGPDARGSGSQGDETREEER